MVFIKNPLSWLTVRSRHRERDRDKSASVKDVQSQQVSQKTRKIKNAYLLFLASHKKSYSSSNLDLLFLDQIIISVLGQLRGSGR